MICMTPMWIKNGEERDEDDGGQQLEGKDRSERSVGVPSLPKSTEVPAVVARPQHFGDNAASREHCTLSKIEAKHKEREHDLKAKSHPTCASAICFHLSNCRVCHRTANIPSTPVNRANSNAPGQHLSFLASEHLIVHITHGIVMEIIAKRLFPLPYRISQKGFCIFAGKDVADKRNFLRFIVGKRDRP